MAARLLSVLVLSVVWTIVTASPGLAQRRRRPARQAPPPAAVPAPEDARAQAAREHYNRARVEFAAGRFSDALNEFLLAYEMRPHPIVYMSIAQCYERLEDYRHAVDYLERYLREVPNAPDFEQVTARVAAHRARPSKVRLNSDPSGGSISIDGRETGQRTPAEIDLAPGTHRIGIRREGFRESSQDAEIAFAERRDLSISLERLAPATRPPPIEPGPAEPPAGPPRSVAPPPAGPVATAAGRTSPVAYVAGALTIAALIAGGVFGSLALMDWQAFDRTPTTELADRVEQYNLFADLSWAAAGAAGATTILLFLFTGGRAPDSAERPDAAALQLAPLAGASGAGFAIAGRF